VPFAIQVSSTRHIKGCVQDHIPMEDALAPLPLGRGGAAGIELVEVGDHSCDRGVFRLWRWAIWVGLCACVWVNGRGTFVSREVCRR
jgi:hypothetical protein